MLREISDETADPSSSVKWQRSPAGMDSGVAVASEEKDNRFKQLFDAGKERGFISEKICDKISDQPWKGFIISISGTKVVISSGRDTGIIPGDILEVYASANTIVGLNGRKFFLPGLKSGEIKITAIYPRRSEAIIISGDNIREGSTVEYR